MKIVYLSSKQCLPGEAGREVDVLEHQQMMGVLRAAFAAKQSLIEDVAWDDDAANWSKYDAAIIGSTWDYCDRYDEFLLTLATIEKIIPVFNSPDLVRWNSHKSYLRDLNRKGVDIVPTSWIDKPEEKINWNRLFEQYGTDSLVVKKQVGANAEGQFILTKDAAEPFLSSPMMVQPFIDSIVSEGEYSLIFIGGELSHSLIKRPKHGDYRIQASYGGREEAVSLSYEDIEKAQLALAALEQKPLYARVDMVRGPCEKLLLMELELIEPFLYPLQSTMLGELLFNELAEQLA